MQGFEIIQVRLADQRINAGGECLGKLTRPYLRSTTMVRAAVAAARSGIVPRAGKGLMLSSFAGPTIFAADPENPDDEDTNRQRNNDTKNVLQKFHVFSSG